MKKYFVPVLVSTLLSYVFYGLYLSQFQIQMQRPSLKSVNPNLFFDYKGVINVHTLASSGSGTLEQVALAATHAGLDFLFVTDLNQFPYTPKKVTYFDKLILFSGLELTYLNSRLLVLEAPDNFNPAGLGQAHMSLVDPLSNTFASRGKGGGQFALAHPFKANYQWNGELPLGIDGIEVVNLKSLWQEAWNQEPLSLFWSLLFMPFNQELSLLRLVRQPRKAIELWDRVAQSRPLIGWIGADAESRFRLPFGNFLSFPSYESLFSLAANHVLLKSELTGDPQKDGHKIKSSLFNGNFYSSLDVLADPKGFLTYLKEASGALHLMGSTVPLTPGLQLLVQLPTEPEAPFDVEIHKDGKKILTSNSLLTQWPVREKGVYRVSVRIIPTLPLPDGKRWFPWILANPFYIQ